MIEKLRVEFWDQLINSHQVSMLPIVCETTLFSGYMALRRHDWYFEKYLPDECQIYKRETEIVLLVRLSFLQSNAAMLQLTVFL